MATQEKSTTEQERFQELKKRIEEQERKITQQFGSQARSVTLRDIEKSSGSSALHELFLGTAAYYFLFLWITIPLWVVCWLCNIFFQWTIPLSWSLFFIIHLLLLPIAAWVGYEYSYKKWVQERTKSILLQREREVQAAKAAVWETEIKKGITDHIWKGGDVEVQSAFGWHVAFSNKPSWRIIDPPVYASSYCFFLKEFIAGEKKKYRDDPNTKRAIAQRLEAHKKQVERRAQKKALPAAKSSLPIIAHGNQAFQKTVEDVLAEMKSKVPYRYTEVMRFFDKAEYVPKFAEEFSGRSDGLFTIDGSGNGTRLNSPEWFRHVFLHEVGHRVTFWLYGYHTMDNQTMEDKANQYADQVMEEMGY
ncbi:MAG TPA: hypothetical protein VKT82_28780 [Ktedonobacterales bacterium]|nr:hypothetical protein [Ktedonobacterales bacterium]